MVLNALIDDESRLEVVDMLALLDLRTHVLVDINLTATGDLGKLSSNIEGEGTELADVDATAGSHVVVQVLDE